MSGSEQFGNKDSDKAWGVQFQDIEFSMFTVKFADGETREYEKHLFNRPNTKNDVLAYIKEKGAKVFIKGCLANKQQLVAATERCLNL
jgi:hypothetical protein